MFAKLTRASAVTLIVAVILYFLGRVVGLDMSPYALALVFLGFVVAMIVEIIVAFVNRNHVVKSPNGSETKEDDQ